MHFVGIKCEICGNIANTKDEIDDLPKGWKALVVRSWRIFLFNDFHRETLHFCSMKCLCAWTRQQEEQSETTSEAG